MVNVEIVEQKGYHFLWIDGNLWMWDVPSEQEAQAQLAAQAYGDVLVAGYGLGLVQKYLLNDNPRVNSVITAELHPKVIIECERVYGEIWGTFLICDFYLLTGEAMYDCVIGDLWIDIFATYLSLYKRFKEKAATFLRPGGKIISWGQDYFEYLLEKEG